MKGSNRVHRFIELAAIIFGGAIFLACADQPPNSVTAPDVRASSVVADAADVGAAIAAQERANPGLLRMPGVIGTAVGLLPNGKARIRIFVEAAGRTFPPALDGIPVSVEVTGRIMASSNPVLKMRPAPLGFSVG